ncbi:MAG: hypothetical protein FVQ80_15425 [Planctomycetes bacterium]|nr:hypothetical protein [Planctomycetota bacterium]
MAKRTFAKSTGLIKLDYGEAPKKAELKTAKNRIYFKNLRYNSETNELSGSINLIRVKAGKSVEDVEKILDDFLDNIETPRGRKPKTQTEPATSRGRKPKPKTE